MWYGAVPINVHIRRFFLKHGLHHQRDEVPHERQSGGPNAGPPAEAQLYQFQVRAKGIKQKKSTP